ncbi:alpha/beta fold hydrolase [Prescottella agglutinans]|uniref:Pimeloyl-ACP methyl ester carboxylesterase n=1 Tax=Prescottella agglutinans TaxID=1644129 RepID=A0ABT6MD46_9NOCA|nr:alpha/beta hydrolase [Prescottella agglutinans]MDH6281319.1 pimeloyl-ACP methyl ester carboxylesterase [Prescottella agglutinans]
MDDGSVSEFAGTASGRAFDERYDCVLGKWGVPVEGVDVETRHGTTRVNVCGPVTAPPVVLLAGGGATSMSWFEVAGELAATHRVFAVDHLGDVGRSVIRERMRGVDDLMEWLADVLDALALASVAVVGHSYGAMVGLAFAIRNPYRVERLVLVDPNSCFAGFRTGYLLRAMPLLIRPTAARQRALIDWETAGMAVDPEWLELVAFGAEHYPATRPVVPRRPHPNELSAMRCPMTVVLAGRSRVHDIRRVEARVRKSVPTARTVVVDGATHYTLPMTAAADLLAVLNEALR